MAANIHPVWMIDDYATFFVMMFSSSPSSAATTTDIGVIVSASGFVLMKYHISTTGAVSVLLLSTSSSFI
jgi:hypothetical protein